MRKFEGSVWVFACVLMLGTASPSRADSARSLVLEGNQAYEAESYEDALKSYEQAIESDPLAAEARFNRGAALYRRNDWAGALDSFESAAALSRAEGDAQLEAASKYNVGNVFFRQGEQASENDPRSAVEALRQSVTSYRDALRLDPNMTNAARNIEVARREMKRLIELAKQQPPGGPSDDKKGENELSEKIKKNLEQQQQLDQDREKVENQQNSPQEQQQQSSELADRQQELQEQTEDLAKEAEQQQQQQDENNQTQQHLEQASQQQQKAAEELERNQLEQAGESQEKAQEELQKALQASQDRPKDSEKDNSEQQQQSAQNAPSEGGKNQASSEPATMPASQALRQEPQDLLDEERANRKRRQLLLLGSGEKVEKDW